LPRNLVAAAAVGAGVVAVIKHPVLVKAEELGLAIKSSEEFKGGDLGDLLFSLNKIISERTRIDYGSVASSGCGCGGNCK
jgi:hypothetical protein